MELCWILHSRSRDPITSPVSWNSLSTVIPLDEIFCHFQKSCGPRTTYCIEDLMLFTFSYNYVTWGWEIHHKHHKTLFRLIELQPGEHLFRFLVESFFFLQLPSAQEPSVVFETVLLLCPYSRSFNFGWQTFFEKTIQASLYLICIINRLHDANEPLVKDISRLCSKENFREPFGLPSILVKVPRPQSWPPEWKFRGARIPAGVPRPLKLVARVHLVRKYFVRTWILLACWSPNSVILAFGFDKNSHVVLWNSSKFSCHWDLKQET